MVIRARRFQYAVWLVVVLAMPLIFSGCTRFAGFAKHNADNAAYKIIRQKQEKTLGTPSDFTLEENESSATLHLLACAKRVEPKDNVEYSTPTCVVGLSESLAIALANSREYQTRKEVLFTQALALTSVRYNYSPIFTATGSANYTRSESGHLSTAIDPVTGELIGSTVDKFGSYEYLLGVSKLMALTGGRISLNFAHRLSRFFNVHTSPNATNNLSLSIVQPLLNGAGPLVAGEPIRQAERSMVYAVRDFRRYQQSFLIDVASSYYGLLQSLDRLNNEYHNYQTTILNRERVEMYAQAGRVPEFQADQARQEELQAADSWSAAQTDYLRQLDGFKFQLGIPLDLDFGPDPKELVLIAERGLVMPEITLKQALDTALENRLDLQNVENQLEDTQREVKIAFRNFLPTLDASYGYSTSRPRAGDDRVDIDFNDNTKTFGLDMILPLDWTPRRNRYRLALIDQTQAIRGLAGKQDSVALEVRDAWRSLQRSKTNYEIQLRSVNLAQRRVESLSLLLEAGRATTRDLLDAQNSLLAAQNALTAALVNHTIQRMQFWNAIERLEVDPKGMWYEQP